MTKPHIAIIIGSTRKARFADKPANWLLEKASARDDMTFELVDLRDFDLPFFDEVASNAWVPSSDPRAVAYSWQRHRIRPEVHWEKREMPRHDVARSAMAWNVSNTLTEKISNDPKHFRLQRYEDFIDSPLETIEAIASFALDKKIKLIICIGRLCYCGIAKPVSFGWHSS